MSSIFVYNPKGVGDHCHSPTLERVGNQIYLAWYAYPEKEHEGAKICYTSTDIEHLSNWAPSLQAINDEVKLSQGNPMLYFHQESGDLFLFYVVLKWTYWDSARIMVSKFDSKEKKFLQPQFVDTPEAIMIRHRPIEGKNHILIPAYDEKKLQTVFYRSEHPFMIWKEASRITGKAIQADLSRISQNELLAILRSSEEKKIVFRAVSPDNGESWTHLLPTSLPCPWSGIAQVKLNSQTTVVAHNNTESHSRGLLSLSITHDGGMNFKRPIEIEGAQIEVSYPTMLKLDDKNFLIAYTFGRKMIKVQKFNIEELQSR